MPSKRRRARRDRENTGGPSPAWMGSVVLLGLVAVVLVIVLIHAAISSPTPAAPAAASPGASPGAVPPAGIATAPGGVPATANAGQVGRPAGCTSSGSDQTVPTSPPSGVTWSLTAGFAVPASASDGPTLRGAGGVGYCYSHTPLGAVLAASNLGQGTGDQQALQDSILKYSVVPNQYAKQVAETPADNSSAPGGIQLAGFRVITYSPQVASIALAYRAGAATDSYTQLTFAMQWYQGDWRDIPQPGPSPVVTNGSVPSLANLVPWAGVS